MQSYYMNFGKKNNAKAYLDSMAAFRKAFGFNLPKISSRNSSFFSASISKHSTCKNILVSRE
jgi:hypothetical protein